MRIMTLAVLLTLSLLPGCTTLTGSAAKSVDKVMFWKTKNAEASRMVAIWSDAVYSEPGKPAARGFGGRLYFYDKDNKAVPVQGQLVVYGFDDSKDNLPAASPDHKFVFTSEQFSQHYTPTELGASYSIWLPWEPAGGMKKTVSLLPVFVTAAGATITGQQTVNTLPGKAPAEAEPASGNAALATLPASDNLPANRSRDGAANAGDLASPVDSVRANRRLRSTTIKLPQDLAQQLIDNTARNPNRPEATPQGVAQGSSESTGSAAPVAQPPSGSAQDSSPAARFQRPRYRNPGASSTP